MTTAITKAGLLLALALALASPAPSLAAGDEAAPGVALWDTRGVADGGGVDLGGRKDWQRVTPGDTAHVLAGDVVVENERIAVTVPRRSPGPIICPKPAPPRERTGAGSSRSSPAGNRRSAWPGSRSARTTRTRLCWRSRAARRTGGRCAPPGPSAGARRSSNASRSRRPPESGSKPPRGSPSSRISSAPTWSSTPGPILRTGLPSSPENFVLDLLEGGSTIVMCVWPTGNQEAQTGPGRGE